VDLAVKEEVKSSLSANDRCDSCGAQAYVWVKGVTGELMFCGHHYTKIMNDESGKNALENFAFDIVDERSEVSDKRAGL
jgi:hypothetical protein